MQLRKVVAATAVALAFTATATACSSNSNSDSSGGGKKITIGIKFDQPGVGLKEPSGKYSGFDVDVATYVAKQLGYKPSQINWKQTPSADRENALQRGDVDLVVASYSITPEREQKVDFAGPYLLAHQDLLERTDENLNKSNLNSSKLKLCSVTGSTSAQHVRDNFAKKAQLRKYSTYSECVNGLASGAVDALTTDDDILAGYASQSQYKGKFKLAGMKLSNENYGIGIKKGDKALKDKVNKALAKMVQDGSWEKAVEANFGPANYKNEPAPQIGHIVK